MNKQEAVAYSRYQFGLPLVVSTVERPVVSDVERPVVSTVERPVVSTVERLVVSTVERLVVSTIEREEGSFSRLGNLWRWRRPDD